MKIHYKIFWRFYITFNLTEKTLKLSYYNKNE